MGLDLGIRSGRPALKMASDLKQYLLHPDKLFRRVRDEHGQLHLSKAAAAYHPGRGVYRSSYKNARRLAATETNIAYRTSDYTRWQQLDFVVGIEVRLSNNHTCLGGDGKPHAFSDICDDLKGRYPKDFKFTGWHPHCRCHAVTILKTPEEMAADNKRIMEGEEPTEESENNVNEVPKEFSQWIKRNEQRIAAAKQRGKLPYFLKDNEKYTSAQKEPQSAREQAAARWAAARERAAQQAAAQQEKLTAKAKRMRAKMLVETKTLADSIGVTIGEPMTHEQADSMRPNPHYGEATQYKINCQSAVVAYELRRRGMDVEAFGNTLCRNGEYCIPYLLSQRTEIAWMNDFGNMPPTINVRRKASIEVLNGTERIKYDKSADSVWKEFLSKTSAEGRYHISWVWNGGKEGHIITMETFADGKRRFYDPQAGMQSDNFTFWMYDSGKNLRINLTQGLETYRVDNLHPNSLLVQSVVKKADSRLETPVATIEQLDWWNRNSYKRTSRQRVLSLEFESSESVKKTELPKGNKNIIVPQSRVDNANGSKAEKNKYLKEYRMAEIFTRDGSNFVFRDEGKGYDGYYNNIPADLKSIKSYKQIYKKGMYAIREQGAKVVLFEFDEITEGHRKELRKLAKNGVHGYFYNIREKIIEEF